MTPLADTHVHLLAGLEPFERQVRVAGAMQRLHAVADGLEHALDLPVAALVDRQLDHVLREPPHLGRSGRPVLELDSFREPPQRPGQTPIATRPRRVSRGTCTRSWAGGADYGKSTGGSPGMDWIDTRDRKFEH